MHQLNLPEYHPRVDSDQIFCLIRKKWVALLPEEWVRQHFLNLLTEELNYPKGMIKLEQSLKYFKNQKRSDIAVFDANGNVFLLVECKSYDEKLNQKVVNQASTYNKVLESQYLAITNGLSHFVWQRKGVEYQQIASFPSYRC